MFEFPYENTGVVYPCAVPDVHVVIVKSRHNNERPNFTWQKNGRKHCIMEPKDGCGERTSVQRRGGIWEG